MNIRPSRILAPFGFSVLAFALGYYVASEQIRTAVPLAENLSDARYAVSEIRYQNSLISSQAMQIAVLGMIFVATAIYSSKRCENASRVLWLRMAGFAAVLAPAVGGLFFIYKYYELLQWAKRE